MSNAKYTDVADDLGPNNNALALIDYFDGDFMSYPKEGSTISSMENHRLHHDTPITYHVVKVDVADNSLPYSITRKLEKIDGVNSVSEGLYERRIGRWCISKITVCGDHVDPVTIIQKILRYAEILSYKIEKNPCDEAFNNHIQNEKPAAEDLKIFYSKISYAATVVNLCCLERLHRIKRKLKKLDGINCVTMDYNGRIEVSGDHVDPDTLVETIEKFAQIDPHRKAKDKRVAAAQGFKKNKNVPFETCVVKVPGYWIIANREKIKKKLLQEMNGLKAITMNAREKTIAVSGDIIDPTRVIEIISMICRARRPELVSCNKKNSDPADHQEQGRPIKNDKFLQDDTKLFPDYHEGLIALPLMEKKHRFDGPVTCVLKVHCSGCVDEIRKTLHKIKGVNFVFSFSQFGFDWKLKVFGDIDVLTITNTILTKYKRSVSLSAYDDCRRPKKKPTGILQRLVSAFETLCDDF
ncbi:uncharacterized protein LOC110745290 [Prunus avium]|uniref:Uncharacterized protein LOC110745290 n=1 Tax=Prunus avium TaxID=42229 RepID=A0A6P5RDM9_PRUAV|nr:uncharacterized protein LOC110745290 [Prunus avium]